MTAVSIPPVMTININDVDEFDVSTPTDSDVAVNAVDENAATNTVVGVTAWPLTPMPPPTRSPTR